MKVATSIILGKLPTPELAAEAVSKAMQKADITIASCVLLLLTSEFAKNPQLAIKAASKAANCTQVMGCSASGIFTEEEWVLDTPAAAVMVFGDGITLNPPNLGHDKQPLFTLTAPNAINSTWLHDGNIRFGGVSGDAIGQGHFTVWQNAKGDMSGQVEAYFGGVNVATKVSHGLKIITTPQQIQAVKDYDILLLDHMAPLLALQKVWKVESKSDSPVPLHLLMAIYANSAEEIIKGQFNQANLIGYDTTKGNITLSQPLKSGQFICWGLRDKDIAEADMTLTVHHLKKELDFDAKFGLFFSCLGRGPFYDGIDHDLKVIAQELPKMPLLGFYGNGEIVNIHGKNQLLPYSAVLSLFTEQH